MAKHSLRPKAVYVEQKSSGMVRRNPPEKVMIFPEACWDGYLWGGYVVKHREAISDDQNWSTAYEVVPYNALVGLRYPNCFSDTIISGSARPYQPDEITKDTAVFLITLSPDNNAGHQVFAYLVRQENGSFKGKYIDPFGGASGYTQEGKALLDKMFSDMQIHWDYADHRFQKDVHNCVPFAFLCSELALAFPAKSATELAQIAQGYVHALGQKAGGITDGQCYQKGAVLLRKVIMRHLVPVSDRTTEMQVFLRDLHLLEGINTLSVNANNQVGLPNCVSQGPRR